MVVLGAPTESLGGLKMGGFGPGGPSANSLSPSRGGNSTTSSVQSFEGKTVRVRNLIPEGLASLAIVVHLVLHIYT